MEPIHNPNELVLLCDEPCECNGEICTIDCDCPDCTYAAYLQQRKQDTEDRSN